MTRRIEGRGLERLQHEAMVSVSQHLVRRATLLHSHLLQRRRSRGRNVPIWSRLADYIIFLRQSRKHNRTKTQGTCSPQDFCTMEGPSKGPNRRRRNRCHRHRDHIANSLSLISLWFPHPPTRHHDDHPSTSPSLPSPAPPAKLDGPGRTDGPGRIRTEPLLLARYLTRACPDFAR